MPSCYLNYTGTIYMNVISKNEFQTHKTLILRIIPTFTTSLLTYQHQWKDLKSKSCPGLPGIYQGNVTVPLEINAHSRTLKWQRSTTDTILHVYQDFMIEVNGFLKAKDQLVLNSDNISVLNIFQIFKTLKII